MQTTTSLKTKAERLEAIAHACADFRSFCGLLKIPPKGGGERIPFILSPIQRRYHRNRTTRDIILKPRQVYMTTLEAARDLWWFLFKPGARVIIVVQSQTDQSALKDVGYKFRIFIDSLRRVGLDLKFGSESMVEWTLPRSDSTMRIIQAGASEASASKKGRGGTVNRLHISEAAFFERAEDTFNSLMESVPKDGSEVVNESTPNGAAGFYYDQWCAAVEGRSGYKPHFFEWWLHPEYWLGIPQGQHFEASNDLERALLTKGCPPECLNWYRWKIADKGGNAELVKQEFPSDPDSCFLVSGRQFFDAERIALMLAEAFEPETIQFIRQSGAHGPLVEGNEVPALRVWHPPVPGNGYVIGSDVSEGTGGDAGGGLVLERRTGRHMATLWGQFKPWELAALLAPLGRKYNNAEIAVERNNHGHACLRALDAEQHYGRIFRDRDDKPGWLTGMHTRTPALDTLEQAVRAAHFVTRDRFILQEMKSFVVSEKTSRVEAAPGKNDDLVMMSAIAWDVICRPLLRNNTIENLPIA